MKYRRANYKEIEKDGKTFLIGVKDSPMDKILLKRKSKTNLTKGAFGYQG